ncbi:MAG: SH3 domain-containing protein, partial [Anaerolineae bacterium]|nr:SH3 domain-containing protein [Anaerolineae bacterium]
MKRYILNVLLLLVLSVTGYAQDTTNDEPPPSEDASAEAFDFGFVATVEVDSGFVRLHPSEDAEAVASVFVDERLEVISRNLDGTWFEVRRPGRMTNLGWVFTELLDWEDRPEFLPLGDAVTGLTSDSASPITTDYAVFIIEGVALRNGPILERSQRLLNIPPSVVVPVLARNQDGSRLYVNYLGTEGWIVGFTARQRNDIMQVPQAPNLP